MLAKQIGQNLHTLAETGKRLYSKIGFLLSKNTLFEFLFVLLHPEVALLSRVRQFHIEMIADKVRHTRVSKLDLNRTIYPDRLQNLPTP